MFMGVAPALLPCCSLAQGAPERAPASRPSELPADSSWPSGGRLLLEHSGGRGGRGGGWFLRHRPWRRQQTLSAAAAAAMASVPTRRGRGPSRPAWCTLELGAGRRSPPPRATAKLRCSDPAVRRWPRYRAASARAAPAPSRQLPLPPTSDCSDEGRETQRVTAAAGACYLCDCLRLCELQAAKLQATDR